MHRLISTLLVLAALGFIATSASIIATEPVAAQDVDTEVPPGNPVIGDDRPGDIQSGSDTNYALWGLIAVCLIGAGVLLIKIEKWEARRIEHQVPDTTRV